MDTAALQRALLALGYPLPRFGADGDFGGETRSAMQAFQREAGLTITDRPDATTIGAMQVAVKQRALQSLVPVTPAIVLTVTPGARNDIVRELVTAQDRFAAAGIVTPLRMAHFLAQAATETGGLSELEESLNYSVDGLLKTFGRSRISAEQCQALGRKPGRAARQEQIANIVYGGEFGRRQLGNTQAGDGWRYRGGGIFQTTGRANYRRAGFEDRPEALRTPSAGLAAALKFWTDNDLNRIADTGTVAAVRRRINGGSNGLAEAEAYFSKARKALGI